VIATYEPIGQAGRGSVGEQATDRMNAYEYTQSTLWWQRIVAFKINSKQRTLFEHHLL
jgi:hypothetical protein